MPNIMTGCDYCITGTLRNGKRFSPIYTKTPWHYNIWSGTLWLLTDDLTKSGRRRRVRYMEYIN